MDRIEILTHASSMHDAKQLDALKSTLIGDLRDAADFEIDEVTKHWPSSSSSPAASSETF